MKQDKKTTVEYWSKLWQVDSVASSINPLRKKIGNQPIRMFHKLFLKMFDPLSNEKTKILEIGCANSSWLPYFNKEFGFFVGGLDYSEVGCERSRDVLVQEGVDGDIVCADLFNPPKHLLGTFDIVISFGVAEHFDDTSKCLHAMSLFLKKEGLLVTSIPNLSGGVGAIQKWMNKPVYDIHNPLNREDLSKAHDSIGCSVIDCNYFMSINFSVLNLNGIKNKGFKFWLKKRMLRILVRFSQFVWIAENTIGQLPTSRFLSPYIICVAKRK